MLTIRLRRTGRTKKPSFRVVVAERDMPIYGRFVDIIGNVNLQSDPKVIEINKEKAESWMKKGAQPSDTVARLMVKVGILKKEDLTWYEDKKHVNKKDKKKQEKDGGEKPKVEAPTEQSQDDAGSIAKSDEKAKTDTLEAVTDVKEEKKEQKSEAKVAEKETPAVTEEKTENKLEEKKPDEVQGKTDIEDNKSEKMNKENIPSDEPEAP